MFVSSTRPPTFIDGFPKSAWLPVRFWRYKVTGTQLYPYGHHHSPTFSIFLLSEGLLHLSDYLSHLAMSLVLTDLLHAQQNLQGVIPHVLPCPLRRNVHPLT